MASIKVLKLLLVCLLTVNVSGLYFRGKSTQYIKTYKRQALQDIVTWDDRSLFVRGERIFLFSGEFHPFRLPVPGLWLDVFQKIKALGFNGVSFYTDWALLEGQPGQFRADGIFALEPFFEAAKTAGVYLLARPGPYINAEVSGGGFPGWLQRVQGQVRTNDPAYLNATDLYLQSVARIIANAQITEGGPVILLQPENEYTRGAPGVEYPNGQYFYDVEEQYRAAGIVIPLVNNDAAPDGHEAPGTGLGSVDIYGHDSYPLGFDCAKPTTWPAGYLPTDYADLHEEQSPFTPYTIVEFQGGSFDPWGGTGLDNCAELLNHEFERVFNKNDLSFGVKILNLYMIFGGTNWGNLGHPIGYTSYDYGASIAEDRTTTREKYRELKLEANFLKVSPAYLSAIPGNKTNANGSYTGSGALAVTALVGNPTNFYVVRHAAYYSLESTDYQLTVPTSAGVVTIPQLGGQLTLHGRDSKIHVTDYSVGKFNLLYSSAEIFTWQRSSLDMILIVYGGQGELHELAFSGSLAVQILEGSGLQVVTRNSSTVMSWQPTSARVLVKLGGGLFLYLLDRNSVYDYWVLDSGDNTSVVLRAGYLVRSAQVENCTINLNGDLNATVSLEIVSGAPSPLETLNFNGKTLRFAQDQYGVVRSHLTFERPGFELPSLADLDWKFIDSLPEIQSLYDDSAWPDADIGKSPNTYANQTTPTSLFAGDYGFHTGNLLFRGHFIATGNETTFQVGTQGGYAYGMSTWLNDTLIGSWRGVDAYENYNSTFTVPQLASDQPYVFTVLLDNMGLSENQVAGDSDFKDPRGILRYRLNGRSQSDITWKLTGNLGGEQYSDLTRGPLNEGGLYAERQGYHLPEAPVSQWMAGKPIDGIPAAGVRFYYTALDLKMPKGYDIPLYFVFSNSTVSNESSIPSYRCQLYVNGYQFGKYVHNVGPQDSFHVPEGVLNYRGRNYIGLSLWALDQGGAKLGGLELQAGAVVQSGYGDVALSPAPPYQARPGAY